jgi:two-component system cell cycle sensor histidine kinase/response regulator CckA
VVAITPKVRAPSPPEEQLAQAQKMEAIGRLTGGIAHDFNNLLLVIAGYSGILLADPATSELGAVKEIAKAAEHGVVLTRQLLAFSRQEVLQSQLLDLNDVVHTVEPMLCRLIGEDVEIAVRLAPEVDGVWADPGALERVLVNLAVNARDAMPAGGTLTIETANVQLDECDGMTHLEGRKGPNVMLAIRDAGIGMSEDVCGRLFEPFFTTKEPGFGTGLGLASIFGAVKQTGGSICVESEEGKGTIFKIYLPADVAPDD